MKNITISVDDATYLKARIWAAWHNTSVSALFRQFLESLHAPPSPALSSPKSAQKRTEKAGLPLF
jgi:hypothetical protein